MVLTCSQLTVPVFIQRLRLPLKNPTSVFYTNRHGTCILPRNVRVFAPRLPTWLRHLHTPYSHQSKAFTLSSFQSTHPLIRTHGLAYTSVHINVVSAWHQNTAALQPLLQTTSPRAKTSSSFRLIASCNILQLDNLRSLLQIWSGALRCPDSLSNRFVGSSNLSIYANTP